MTVSVRRYGCTWHVGWGTREVVVSDIRGMGYLSVLVANPGFEIPAVELVSRPGRPEARAFDNASHDPVLDDAAKRAYRKRLDELSAEIDEYEDLRDPIRAERARTEREWLIAQLRAAVGLGGRDRPFATDAERARIAVGKAIRRAIARIGRADAAIGDELARTVKTGVRCAYLPPGTGWNAYPA